MAELSTMGFQASRKNQATSAVFPWRILIISIVVFGLMVLIYAGITFGYTPYLESQLSNVRAEADELNKKIDENQKKEIIDFYSQLYNIKALGAGHVYPYNFFAFLERTTYPLTKITALSFAASGLEARLEGIASDFDVLTEQIASYRNDPQVLSVMLDSSRKRDAKEGTGVIFSLKILINKEMMQSAATTNTQ